MTRASLLLQAAGSSFSLGPVFLLLKYIREIALVLWKLQNKQARGQVVFRPQNIQLKSQPGSFYFNIYLVSVVQTVRDQKVPTHLLHTVIIIVLIPQVFATFIGEYI